MKINNLYKFFDFFGLPVFLFLLIDSLLYIYSGSLDWRILARLVIGIGGLIIDGFLVFFYKKEN